MRVERKNWSSGFLLINQLDAKQELLENERVKRKNWSSSFELVNQLDAKQELLENERVAKKELELGFLNLSIRWMQSKNCWRMRE